ncbi:MAG: hypothetical protein ACKOPS_27520 [Cyanobium sp.]
MPTIRYGEIWTSLLERHCMAKRRNLKKEKQERNRAYARKFKKRKLRNDGRGEGAGNGVTGTANNGGAAD